MTNTCQSSPNISSSEGSLKHTKHVDQFHYLCKEGAILTMKELVMGTVGFSSIHSLESILTKSMTIVGAIYEDFVHYWSGSALHMGNKKELMDMIF